MKLKNLLSLLLAAVLLFTLAGCAGSAPEASDPAGPDGTEATVPSDAPTADPTDGATESTSGAAAENPVTFLSLNYGEDYEHLRSLIAYTDDTGAVQVEYVGDVKKVGQLDAAVFTDITLSLADSGLLDLNGKEEWSDGTANASMYIEFADGSAATANFGGTVPQEFIDGYMAMEVCFEQLTASLPVYVPQVQIMGEVDADELAALQQILNNSGIESLDMLAITPVAVDEFFAMTMGLSGSDGIVSGSSCGAMMMTTAFSLNVVTVSGEDDTGTVCADFEASMDWRKWVCVAPTNALIAAKGDMVLCLMGSDAMYTGTAAAIENAGWTIYKALENPDIVG